MVIINTLRDFLTARRIQAPIVVAASGGVDSTALLVAFAELSVIEFEVAHVNHHLRGADSDADEAFVRDLCATHGVTLHVMDGTLDGEEIRRGGIETAARKIRYAKLKALGRTIATAHHKNDQAETVLMRMLTGGGVAALRGIHPVRDDGIIRPLLTVTRGDIDRFLADRGLTARVDKSNADPRFLRNRVRALLARLDAGAVDVLASVADRAWLQWRMYEQMLDEADTSIATAEETRFENWPDDRWLRRALLHRHIQRLDPDARDVSAADLERLADDTAKRVSVTANLELVRKGGQVTLRKRLMPSEPFELELHPGDSVVTPIGTLRLSSQLRGGQRFQLPRGAKPAFMVRNRRNGDRFQPLGMARSKKLKDFLIDRKIPAEVRDRIPLLLWEDQIVWVAGVEISERFKITAESAGDLYEASIEENQEGLQREGDRNPGR